MSRRWVCGKQEQPQKACSLLQSATQLSQWGEDRGGERQVVAKAGQRVEVKLVGFLGLSRSPGRLDQ